MRRSALTHIGRLCAVTVLVLPVAAACDASAGNGGLMLHVGAAPGETPAFDPATVNAPPSTTVIVRFSNRSSLDHNLVFVSPLDAGSDEIVPPGASDGIELVTPGAGAYRFVCTIHEGMEGMLVVQ